LPFAHAHDYRFAEDEYEDEYRFAEYEHGRRARASSAQFVPRSCAKLRNEYGRRVDTRACWITSGSMPTNALCDLPSCPFRFWRTCPSHAELSDQLRRATISIPLNIAEGAGKTTDKDRSRYHASARGSAMECGAIIDVLRMQALTEPTMAAEAKSLLVRLVAMLSKMCR